MSAKDKGHEDGEKPDPKDIQIVDFKEARARRLEEKRRNTERILFKQMLGIYGVTGNDQMRPIELLDVSDEGLSFQTPFDPADQWAVQLTEFPIRLYFSQDTYLAIQVTIHNVSPLIIDGLRYNRCGCSVDKSFASYETFLRFVNFLKSYCEHAHKDQGGVTLFYV